MSRFSRLLLSLALLAFFSPGLRAEVPKLNTVMVGGHPMAVWEKSPARPRASLLLLHGRTYSSLPDFDLQVEGEQLSFMDSLVDKGFRVYALDARGYGKTPRDESGWLTPDRAAKDVIAVAGWIKRQTSLPLNVYGWSYGSMLAQLVAQRQPDLFRSVILFGYPFDPQRHLVDKDHTYPAKPPAKPNSKQHAASDFITPGNISQRAIDAYVKQALAADPIRVDFKGLDEWAELDPSKLTIPTLLIQGEFDPLARTDLQWQLFSRLSAARKWWVVLQGSDHAGLLETQRKEMLTAMDAFLTAQEQ